MELSTAQLNKLKAAAEIVEKGDMAVLQNILEFKDFLDDLKEQWEVMKAELGETLPTELQNRVDEMSISMEEECKKCEEMCQKMEDMMNDPKHKEEIQKMVADSESKLGKDISDWSVKMTGMIAEVKGLIPEMPDAFDPTDILNRVNEIEAKIPKEVDLSGMEGDIQVIKEDIVEIKKDIEELKKRPATVVSGGTSAMAVARSFKYIFHTEEPTGAIDGNNTTYTVKNNIWAIIGFTLNGESIAELPNYTFANKTITFSSAIPVAYSGKDWEIKYIGS